MTLAPGQDDPSGANAGGSSPQEQQVEQIYSLLLARIEQKIEQKIEHQHLPLAVPSAEEAADLRSQAPEVYNLWLDLARKRADEDARLQRLPYEYPFQLAKRGQWFGLSAMFAVLGFCAYLASLGGGVQYVAGVIAALDLVAIIGVFMANARGGLQRQQDAH
jgi:hypothetical protein